MGLGDFIKTLWTGIRGRIAPMFSRSHGPLSLEKVRTAGSFGALQFLPQHDGLTEETAEIRAAYRVMLRDESVKSALQRKVDQVCALDWQIHAEDEDDAQQRRAAQWLDWMTDRMDGGKPQIAAEVLTGALIEGHSVGEKVWDFDPVPAGKWAGFHRHKALKGKDPKYAQLTVDQFRNVIAVRGTAWNSGKLYDPADFVVFTHMPLWSNPQGMSDLRAAYRYYVLKHNLWLLRAIYLEKYAAGGMMKGKYSRNELRASLEAALAAAKASTYVALPDGTDMDMIDLATRGGNDFESAIADCDKAMVVSISGAFLQSLQGTTPQGRGDSSVHQDTADLAVWRLAKALSYVLTFQLFQESVRVNFGAIPTPMLTLGGAKKDADLLPSWQIDSGMIQAGIKLSKKYFWKKYNRPAPDGPGDVLEVQSQGQGGEGGGAGGLGLPGPGGPAPVTPAGGGGAGPRTPYRGQRGGTGWKDAQGGVHYGDFSEGGAPAGAMTADEARRFIAGLAGLSVAEARALRDQLRKGA
jgi:phage gp29-like protein